MADVWQTFPAQMGEHRAFISFNQSYSQIAEKDPRTSLVKVRLQIKKPTSGGMPTDDEFSVLASVEDKLTDAIESQGGVEVGRVTVNGQRFFTFYASIAKDAAEKLISSVARSTNYPLQFIYEQDAAKNGYWKELYPTDDDWQVIRDLKVLDALRNQGDNPEVIRQVSHWAYFKDEKRAKEFCTWAQASGYVVTSQKRTSDKTEVGVHFDHKGSMRLEDITHHTIGINRKVAALGGKYDGWETSVERVK
jgi:hypothetical protein